MTDSTEADSLGITALLERWSKGEKDAYDQLLTHLYGDIHAIAIRQLHREHYLTIRPTALARRCNPHNVAAPHQPAGAAQAQGPDPRIPVDSPQSLRVLATKRFSIRADIPILLQDVQIPTLTQAAIRPSSYLRGPPTEEFSKTASVAPPWFGCSASHFCSNTFFALMY